MSSRQQLHLFKLAIVLVVVILRWSVTEESINRLVIVVVTSSAYAFAVVIVEVVDVIFLVEVVVVIEPVVLVREDFFRPFYGNSANTQHLFSP